MNMNSFSLSYLFLAVGLLSFIFFCYFKILHWNTSDKSDKKEKIIGKMKNVEEWRGKNNRLSYIFLFWSVVSIGIFIYFKYYLGARLISSLYIIGYLALIIISSAIGGIKGKAKA
jgi:hypothetical protein